jgi:hypothetical protein
MTLATHTEDVDRHVVQSSQVTRAAAPIDPRQDFDVVEPALDRLRRLRGEVQDLREVLRRIMDNLTTAAEQANYLQKTAGDIALLRDQIEGNDTADRLRNVLEQLEYNPLLAQPQTELDPQVAGHQMTILLEQIRRIEFYVGLLTIPARLNDWLARSRPGYYVPFHQIFADEVPTEEDRQIILQHIAWTPEVVENGIVDLANGLVYRYPSERRERLQGIAWLVGGLAAAALIVAGLAWLNVPLPNEGENQPTAISLLVYWGAVLVGIIAHMGVESVKREQDSGLPAVVAMNDWPLLLSAKAGLLMRRLLLALIGFFGLLFGLGYSDLNIVNAFLIGYSLDSFIGLFGKRFETQGAALQSRFSSAEKS